MLVRVKAKSSETMRNQNKSSHHHLPCPRLAAARDMGPSLSTTDCTAHTLSCPQWHLPRPQQVLPNPPLSLVPKVWQGPIPAVPVTPLAPGGARSDSTLAESVSLSSLSAPCAWHLHVDTVWGPAVPLGKGHLGPRCHPRWGKGVATRLLWGLQGEESLSLALSLLPSLLLIACQQPAQGLGGWICPLEVEGQGLGTASCHEMTVR